MALFPTKGSFGYPIEAKQVQEGLKEINEACLQVDGALPYQEIEITTDGLLKGADTANIIVLAEGNKASGALIDDLSSITGTMRDGGTVRLKSKSGHTINVIHSTGTNGIRLNDRTSSVLSSKYPLMLRKIGSYWQEEGLNSGYAVDNGLLGTYITTRAGADCNDVEYRQNGRWKFRLSPLNGPPGLGSFYMESTSAAALEGVQIVTPIDMAEVYHVVWMRKWTGNPAVFSDWVKIAGPDVGYGVANGQLGPMAPSLSSTTTPPNNADLLWGGNKDVNLQGGGQVGTPLVSTAMLKTWGVSENFGTQTYQTISSANPRFCIRSRTSEATISPWKELAGTFRATTASASNCFLDANSSILISSSSIRYKKDVEDMDERYAVAFLQGARPVWYKSLSNADNPAWGHWGFIAEDLEEVDPRLVHFVNHPDDVHEEFTDVETEKEVENEDGTTSIVKETVRESLGIVPNNDARLIPEGVQYDRITALLTKIAQMQEKKIEELEERISKLEGKNA